VKSISLSIGGREKRSVLVPVTRTRYIPDSDFIPRG
jgi:hypothetical protein